MYKMFFGTLVLAVSFGRVATLMTKPTSRSSSTQA